LIQAASRKKFVSVHCPRAHAQSMSSVMRLALLACASIAAAQKVSNEPVLIEVGTDRLIRRESLKSISAHADGLRAGPLGGVLPEPDTPAGDEAANAAEGTNTTVVATTPVADNTVAATPGTTADTTPVAEETTPAETTDETPAAETAGTVTQSGAYKEAVLASHPVSYWTLGNVGGVCPGRQPGELDGMKRSCGLGPACGQAGWLEFGDSCLVDGKVSGTPTSATGLVPSKTSDGAIKFSGAANEEVVIPDSAYINTNSSGCPTRTVELWFQTESPGELNRTIYAEGNEQHSGLNMYVQEDDDTNIRLYMYAWDRGNEDNEFGTALIEPDPISCKIEKDTPYYVAMEFNSPAHTFIGWIGSGATVSLCGSFTDLPVGVTLKHHGHGGGNPTIGGIEVSSRSTGTVSMVGTSHNFQGVIDEVAIYNRPLPKAELDAHYAAGTGSATSLF